MKTKTLLNLIFLATIFFVSSCILESKKDEKNPDDLLDQISSLQKEKENDFYKDTIDYNSLVVSKDSVDIVLVNLIRGYESFSPQKLLSNVEILIEKGANPNNNIKETWVSKRIVARVPILKHFVKRKYNTGTTYTTAFHSAVHTGRIDLVNLLYEKGFNANIPSKDGNYPFDMALQNDDLKMIDFLVEKNVNLKVVDLSNSVNTDLIVKLVGLGANPKTIDFGYALENAKEMEKLLALKPDMSSLELDFSELFKNEEVFNLLMDNGLNPNIKGKFPFKCSLIYGAIKFGTLDNVKKVVKKGGNYKEECQMQFYSSPLIASIKLNDTAKIAYFVDLALPLNTRDWKGDTPLSEAIDNDDDVLIKFLIKKGAKVNYPMERGETHLMHAVKMDKYIAAEVLIESGAEMNSKEKYGKTCLVYAIEDNNLAMVKLLLEKGADKNIKYKGKTLSNFALGENASAKIVSLLE